jgi:hypothetical protein
MSREYLLLPLPNNSFNSMSDDKNITRTSRFLEALERLNQWLSKDFNVTTASKDERDVFIRYKN